MLFSNNGIITTSYSPSKADFELSATKGLTFITTSENEVLELGHINSITSRTTAALGKISYDAYGHITGFTEVDSLKNPESFKIFTGEGTTEGTDLYTYDGSVAKSLNITAGSNIALSPSAGTLSISAIDTRYKLIMGSSSSATSSVTAVTENPWIRLLTTSNTNSGTFQIKGSKATSVTTDTAGNITISSTNTWRPVNAWNLSEMNNAGDSIDTVLPESTGTNALSFSSTFAYSNNMLDIVWAEVDESGTVTYKI